MPLTANPKAGAAGPALPLNHLPAQAAQQISNAIGMINVNNIFGPVGGIPQLQDIFGWRVDRQNALGNEVNLSVQRNNVGAPSTVASVFVPTLYNVAPPAAIAGPLARLAYDARMRELGRTVRRGLEESFATYAPPLAPPHANARSIQRFEAAGNFSG